VRLACKSCANGVNFAVLSSLRTALFWCAVVFCLGQGCRGAAPAHGPYREFTFTVDSTWLGDGVMVAGLSLRVPLGWTAVDSAVMEVIRHTARLDSGVFSLEPQTVFLGADSNSLLVISTFRHAPDPSEGFTGWARRYVEAYREARPELAAQEEWLLLGGVHAVQLFAMDTLRVQFKFLIESEPAVGLDYSVPRSAWEGEARAVESSLGTIRKR
jgi:hypothetical protein